MISSVKTMQNNINWQMGIFSSPFRMIGKNVFVLISELLRKTLKTNGNIAIDRI